MDNDSLYKVQSTKYNEPVVVVFETKSEAAMTELRKMFFVSPPAIPVIIRRKYSDISPEQFQLFSATDVGGLLVDGLGDGVWLTLNNKHQTTNNKLINTTSFGILQATRTRISKTDYISCPSCGRTLFELQETTARIRARTNHLKGLKIAIMGCIVNGPGEMADADFGYVGSGPGKITLYKGKEVMKRNVNSEIAVEELINLIKESEAWVEV